MKKVSLVSLGASISLVLAFTFSCSSDANSGGGSDGPSEPVTHGGQTYNTVRIGKQVWIAENLNYEVDGSFCYDNLESNCTKYGRLYDWATVTTMNICPNGWHIPSNKEWTTLTNYVKKNSGTKLKATTDWNQNGDISGNGTDDYGFAALPGGHGYAYSGGFTNVGRYGYWWSSTEHNADYAYFRFTCYECENMIWDRDRKLELFSVRCVKD